MNYVHSKHLILIYFISDLTSFVAHLTQWGKKLEVQFGEHLTSYRRRPPRIYLPGRWFVNSSYPWSYPLVVPIEKRTTDELVGFGQKIWKYFDISNSLCKDMVTCKIMARVPPFYSTFSTFLFSFFL